MLLATVLKKLTFGACLAHPDSIINSNSMVLSRRFSVLLVLILASFSVFAQEKVKKIARPDIPGSFIVDLGLNRGSHTPANWRQGLWGSRTLNVYYQYPLRLLKSK